MTDNEGAREMSLIQQRMRLDRERIAAIWWLLGAVILTVGNVWTLVSEGADASFWRWGATLFFAVSAVGAIVRLIVTLRRLRRFTAEHGPDAERQKPVGRP